MKMSTQDFKTRTFFDYLLFILSAAVISGVLFGLKDLNWVTLVGYGLALFWMFSLMIYRGICKSYIDYIQQLENVIKSDIIKNIDKNEK